MIKLEDKLIVNKIFSYFLFLYIQKEQKVNINLLFFLKFFSECFPPWSGFVFSLFSIIGINNLFLFLAIRTILHEPQAL